MALILPGQPNNEGEGLKLPASSNKRLVLPGSAESQRKAERAPIDKQIAVENAALDKEASRSFASRFLEELGITAKEIAQGTARSFISAGQAITTGSLSKPFQPTTGFEKALVGDKPVSFKTLGEEYAPLLNLAGVSEETTKKFSIPIGLLAGSLDLIPGLPGKKKAAETALRQLAEAVAKSSDEIFIENALKTVVKGDDETLKALSKGLKDVTNPDDVRSIIDVTLKEGKAVSSAPTIKVSKPTPEFDPVIKRAADDIIKTGVKKDEFVKSISAIMNGADASKKASTIQLLNKLDELKLTPGKLYDMTVSSGGGKGLDRIGRQLLKTPADKMITRTEMTVLKERIKNISRGAREGAVAKKDEIFELQDMAIKYASDNLPVALRGSLLKTVRDANNPDKLMKSVERITKKIDEYEALQQARKELSGKQSKISFLKKLGEFNQTAIQDAKKTLGIKSPIRQMNSKELDSMVAEMSKRLRFKQSEGLFASAPKAGSTRASDDFYSQFIPDEKSLKDSLLERGKNLVDSIKEGSEDLLGVISTRLEKIDPSLKYALRKFEFNVRTKTLKNYHVAKALTEKVKKIPPQDFAKLDVAMKNGLIDDAKDIAKKHGFESELEAVRTMLDDIYRRANEVGLEVEYRKNFFPRAFKTDKKSTRGVLEYFGRNDSKGVVQKAFKEASTKLGRVLTDEEKVNVINTLMRGFRTNSVTLSKTGALKNRIIETVTPELNQFYDNSFDAINRYVEGTNNLIESRRFFGKHLDMKKIEPNADMDDVIGAYVNNLISAGKLDVEQQLLLSRILKARFSGKEMAPWLGAVKNVGYLSVMSSPINAITQIGDLALTFFNAGLKGVPGVGDAIIGKGLKRADLGIENIAAEFSSKSLLSKFVDKTFKLVGLDRVDRLGKESFINGTWRSLRQQAVSSPEKIKPELKKVFGDDADQVLKDLMKGEATEDVKYLLFNELLDFQPVALSEVPLKYLEAPNGRIFYALKTYMIKTWDIFRREAFQLMKTPGRRAEGAQNLMKLTALLMLFNGTADEIKDFITGKEDISWQDRMFESFAKAVGFSRYATSQIGKEGIGRALAEQILPPTQLADDLTKDFKDVFIDQDEDAEVARLRTIRDIPAGGKLFYYWFGRGDTKKEEGDGISVDIPSVKIPSVKIPTIKI